MNQLLISDLAESIDQILILLSNDHTILSLNPAFETATGVKKEVWIGRNFRAMLRDCDLPLFQSCLDEASKENLKPSELVIHLQPSEKRTLKASFKILHGTAQERGGSSIWLLLRLIGEHEIRLQELKLDLARSNKDLDHLSQIASHDLKEPLRMISLYLEILKKRSSEKLDSHSGECIEFAIASAKRLSMLIDALLHYAFIARNEYRFAYCKTEEVFGDVLTDLKNKISEANAEVSVDVLPALNCHRQQIYHLFHQLLSNALKFRSADRKSFIRVRVKEDSKDWIISMEDNGIGFEMAHSLRIFHIFKRLHPRELYAGSGIGLALAKKVVENHGGRIWAESELGQGAVFCFTLKKDLCSL